MVERRYTVKAIFIGFILCLVAASPVVLLAQEAVGEAAEKAVEETPTFELTIQSAQDSLGTAKNDSMAVARDVADMAERKRLGIVLYNLKHSGIGEKYVDGGNFMHALLLASIVGLVFIIERLVTLSRARINVRSLMSEVLSTIRSEGIDGAMGVCERTRGPIAAVLHSGLLRSGRGPDAVKEAIETAGSIETSFLERGLVAIATVAQVAPLLGFLGTVSGMISAFAAIASAEQVSAKVVASGIEEALITTATGLIIAIPASIGHSFFVSQIDRFVLEMEEASAELVNELIELEIKK
ncbi:MAG: MotA/TolQ/ExbB proton channel family protein [Candidatus Krumholzibacteriota bacterium]|nr:MotA/TolQ/ExbB proton channel family protein [Candidatus Krumholzibacteriota bacterium]